MGYAREVHDHVAVLGTENGRLGTQIGTIVNGIGVVGVGRRQRYLLEQVLEVENGALLGHEILVCVEVTPCRCRATSYLHSNLATATFAHTQDDPPAHYRNSAFANMYATVCSIWASQRCQTLPKLVSRKPKEPQKSFQ